jgi:hypothetical protein
MVTKLQVVLQVIRSYYMSLLYDVLFFVGCFQSICWKNLFESGLNQ